MPVKTAEKPKTLVVDPRSRYAPSALRAVLKSSDLTITDNWVIRLKRIEARSEEQQFQEFDLNQILLPANGLYKKSTVLAKRGDLAAALLCGLDAIVLRGARSVSRTRRVGGHVNNIALFMEALWLDDHTRLDTYSVDVFMQLASDLSLKGWPEVLRLKKRAEEAGITRAECDGALAGANIRRRIGTNYWEVADYLRRCFDATSTDEVAEEVALEEVGGGSRKKSKRSSTKNIRDEEVSSDLGEIAEKRLYSSSRFSGFFQSVNLLYDATDGYGLSFCPFPHSFSLARELGRPPCRTNNLTIGFAGRLYRVCMIWVYERAPAILNLLEKLTQVVEENREFSRKTIARRLAAAFAQSEERSTLNEILPFPLENLDMTMGDRKDFSFRSVMACLLASCFVLVAFMNARRKREVSDRKIGLMCGCLNVVSEGLALFEVDFYIEKSYMKRMPYYVNDTTCLVIRILEDIQHCYRRIDVVLGAPTAFIPFEEIPLFSYRRYSANEGIGPELKWFDFQDYSRSYDDVTNLIRESGGGEELMFGETQVFRRMYCLISYYRYENSDIVAINHQLGQKDLESTRVYVTDPESRPEMETIFARIPSEAEDRRRAFLAEDANLAKEMRNVGEMKLAEEVYEILAGETFAGGFAKFVRRLFARLSSMVSFKQGDTEDAVVQIVKRRGHFPRPLRHGECMLGAVMNRKAGNCYSDTDQNVHVERASVQMCDGCVYHLSKVAYVNNLRADRVQMKAEIASSGLEGFALERRNRELVALDEGIALLCERLGISNEDA
ncbi:hypothetical protein [Paraburkholderia diazotrophica]|uniref:hypothetical protein n=1 Tax=Paraburkholderia diazotrophica TaxID=667676 RepID=UPI00316C12FE